MIIRIFLVGLVILCTGCTLTPRSYDEHMEIILERGYGADTDYIQAEWKYHLDFQYYRMAWNSVNESESTGEELTAPHFNASVGRNLATVGIGIESGFDVGLTNFIFDFASALGPENAHRIYYNLTRNKLAFPNVTFAKLYPTSSEVSFDEALYELKAVYKSLYNDDGNCKANGYTEELQYRKVRGSIYEPGLYFRFTYRCTSAVDGSNSKMVVMHLLADPANDVGMLAMIGNECVLKPDGENGGYVDTTQCGRPEANRLSQKITGFEDWLMLVTEPSKADKGIMEINVEYKGNTLLLPDPQIINEEYREFLRAS